MNIFRDILFAKRHLKKMLAGKLYLRISFFFLGIASTAWFLIRVIPKPSRAGYPCMRAAAPFMSGFIIYLISITGSVFAFRKLGKKLVSAKYIAAFGFLAIAAVSVFIAGSVNNPSSNAATLAIQESLIANDPIGVANGLKPGRVVWVYNPGATDENCNNSSGDYWYQDDNTNQDTVRKMLADGIIRYSEADDLANAWNDLFEYFNVQHSKGNVGYSAGEKIVIKLNMTNMGSSGRTLTSLMNSTPQLVLAILEELIDSVGVAQADITIGDPYRGFGDFYWDKCHGKYPNVHYIEGSDTDGRQITEISGDDVFFTSDVDNPFASRLPQAYLDAAYLINMPCMKSHNSAGITLAAKNHQGSVIAPSQNATNQYMGNDLHYCFPDVPENQVLGIYRHIVDYIAHSKLGGNTLVYIVDAIWSGRNWNGYVDKWGMSPFDGDYTSSLFISQDPVAIESVGYDFLYNEYSNTEYRNTYHEGDDFPLWVGVDDYILQAADPAYWPSGIEYDPDHADHNSPVGSLGVYEHWNNISDKQYSRNLGTGDGIELVSVFAGSEEPNFIQDTRNNNSIASIYSYPNPATDIVFIEYMINAPGQVNIEIFAIDGKKVGQVQNRDEITGTHQLSWNVEHLQSGSYILRVSHTAADGVSTLLKKFEVY